MLAISGKRDSIAKVLIEKNADINLANAENATPLFIAAARGNLEISALLIDKGADVNAKTTFGWAPLHVAAFKGYDTLATRLLEAGAVCSITETSDVSLYATARAYELAAGFLASQKKTDAALEHYQTASKYFNKSAEVFGKVSDDISYSRWVNRGVGAAFSLGSAAAAASSARSQARDQARHNAKGGGTGVGYGVAPYIGYKAGSSDDKAYREIRNIEKSSRASYGECQKKLNCLGK
jgi:hypothetical protein